MTSSEPSSGAAARRPRRAVRLAGTVGGDDANLVSAHPAHPAHPALAADPHPDDATAARRDTAHEPPVAARSVDDSDVGWGDREPGSNDDRLHQDKPPHW